MSELPLHLATPMIRSNNFDYFVFEPVLLTTSSGGGVCMPFRWFTRNGAEFAKAWRMISASRETDGGQVLHGWYIYEYDVIEVPASQLLLPFPIFKTQHENYHVPCPSSIFGTHTSAKSVFLIDMLYRLV